MRSSSDSSVTRTFLGWDRAALPLAAEVLLDHYAADGEARLDGAVVTLPGSRAGRRLKEILVERAGAGGLRLVPPRIVTIGALPELLYESVRPLASSGVAGLTWAAALRAVPPRRLETVFGRLPGGEDLHDWTILGRELARVHREVARGGHRFDEVAARCRTLAARGEIPWDDADRWKVLATVQEEYASRLASMELDDRDLARIAAVREGRLGIDADVWVVGVSEMATILRRFLTAIEDRVRSLVHAPEERADAFDDLGCVRPEAWLDLELPLDEDRLSIRDRPGHQADEVTRKLSALGGRYAPDEIVVGVPDPELVPWIEERLTGAGVPVRDAAGEATSRTAPYRLLSAVADFLEDHRYQDFAALVRHPDVEGWIATQSRGDPRFSRPGSWLEALDRYQGRHLQKRITGGIPGRKRRHGEITAALWATVETEMLASLTDTPHERSLSRWTTPVLETLSLIYGHRPLSVDRPHDRRITRELELLGESIRAFERLPPEVDRRCGATAAIRVFLDLASSERVPADPGRRAVELLGWLELHLDDVPVTVITGVNEPWLPESVNAAPFLPDALRARLGLQDNRLRYARDAYRLTAMIRSREELELITGRRTTSGDPLRPSRLLFAADPESCARRVRRFYDEEVGAGDGGNAPGGEAPAGSPDPTRASSFSLPPEPEIRADEPLVRLRVTDFKHLLEDPYGFALKEYRGCEPLDDHAREMDGLVFGGLAHAVLERFGNHESLHLEDEATLARILSRLLDEELEIRFGRDARNAYAAVRLQIEQLRARLRRFARWHAGWIGDGWRVRGVECSTGRDGVLLDVDREDVDQKPVVLDARIDRVDYHPERDLWAVFDYKTSDRGSPPEKTHRTNYGKDWCDLQLPLYRWLLPRLVTEGGAPLFGEAIESEIRVGYILLPRDLDGVGESLADWDEGDFSDALETARATVRRFRREPFTFEPDRYPKHSDAGMDALLGRGQLTTGAREADTP